MNKFKRVIFGACNEKFKVAKGDMVQIANGDWFEVINERGEYDAPNTIAIRISEGAMCPICCALITKHKGGDNENQ